MTVYMLVGLLGFEEEDILDNKSKGGEVEDGFHTDHVDENNSTTYMVVYWLQDVGWIDRSQI